MTSFFLQKNGASRLKKRSSKGFYRLHIYLCRWLADKSKPSIQNSLSKGECGLRLTDERVVGGEVARLGEFPYVALLGYLIGNEIFYLCGGSILNSKYILTAAHCHSSKQPIR